MYVKAHDFDLFMINLLHITVLFLPENMSRHTLDINTMCNDLSLVRGVFSRKIVAVQVLHVDCSNRDRRSVSRKKISTPRQCALTFSL